MVIGNVPFHFVQEANGVQHRRRAIAKRYGRDYLQRSNPWTSTLNELEVSSLSRSFRHTLEKMFEQIRYVPSVGYSLFYKNLSNVNEELKAALTKATPTYREQGKDLPTLPIWGLYGDPDECWEPADFEILAYCYMEEVESFLKDIITTQTGHYQPATPEPGPRGGFSVPQTPETNWRLPARPMERIDEYRWPLTTPTAKLDQATKRDRL